MRAFAKQLFATVLVALTLVAMSTAAPAVRTFGSPEDATRALFAALKAKDNNALLAIFGPDYNKVKVQDAAQRAVLNQRLVRLFNEGWSLTTTQDQHRVIRLGYEGWSFPVPLIKRGSAWSFDMVAGIEELANRRVGRNELMAIDTFTAFNQAQKLYHDANGKYAAHIVSTQGAKDGLYYPKSGSDVSPLEQVIGGAAAVSAAHLKGTPWFGYYYTLTLQSDGGYAYTAWPASYDNSGVMSFWSDESGQIYEKDLGANGGSFLRGLDATSNPQGWNLVSQ